LGIFDKVTEEEEERVLKKAYDLIEKYGLHDAALLMLYSVKPFAPLGGALGRFILGPLIPFIGHREESVITTFEQSRNIENLIEMIEVKRKEDRTKKEEERKSRKEKKEKGLRRFWPF
jgi:hypothetical protein